METVKSIKYRKMPDGSDFDPIKAEGIIREVLLGIKRDDQFYKIKTFLYQVNDSKRLEEQLKSRISDREEALQYLKSSYSFRDGCIKATSIEMAEEEIKAIYGSLRKAEENLARVTVVVGDAIAKLENVNQQMVITKRYIQNKGWDEIAEEMGYSVRGVQKLHQKALPLLQEIVLEYERKVEGNTEKADMIQAGGKS